MPRLRAQAQHVGAETGSPSGGGCSWRVGIPPGPLVAPPLPSRARGRTGGQSYRVVGWGLGCVLLWVCVWGWAGCEGDWFVSCGVWDVEGISIFVLTSPGGGGRTVMGRRSEERLRVTDERCG